MIARFLRAGRFKVLSLAAAMILVTAFADWSIGTRASLGLFYILPMMLAATTLSPIETALLAFLCACLRSWFDLPSPPLEVALRLIFSFLTYLVSGLFVVGLIRIEREQASRREAEDQLGMLVQSSPAAILTVSSAGVVLAANNSANDLFGIPAGQTLRGRSIGGHLPVLADALRLGSALDNFRTAAQGQGRRENGEIFLAHTWFSSYTAPEGVRLAAIVVDSSEEMRDREEQNLRQLTQVNQIAAAAVYHEVRNLCSAISLLCSNLKHKHALAQDDDFRGLTSLVGGLENAASLELHSHTPDSPEEVSLRSVLDDLRIVIEPDWKEFEGLVHWDVPSEMPAVLADRHGLLQVFLNLARNSRRAMEQSSRRELSIVVRVEESRVTVRFLDTGPGIAAAERLFEPFQRGAEGTGLGLYVSRAVVRSYGGELRFEPAATGSCFVIELELVPPWPRSR